MINENSTVIWKVHSDIMCFHSPKASERNTNRGGMYCAKKGGNSGLLQACVTSFNTSIHSVKGEKQQEMQWNYR